MGNLVNNCKKPNKKPKTPVEVCSNMTLAGSTHTDHREPTLTIIYSGCLKVSTTFVMVFAIPAMRTTLGSQVNGSLTLCGWIRPGCSLCCLFS